MQTILIVGGGAGGLELATKLGHGLGKKNKARIILVDRNRRHIWKPLLHEVATGSLDINTDGVVYRAHAAKHHYEFQLGTMVGLDAENKQIQLAAFNDEEGKEVLPERNVAYDTLVLAVGSVSNDFGTKGVSEHCYFLDSHAQAEKFHLALLNQFLRISQQPDGEQLHLAIVGGGATGVELSAELYHVAGLLKIYGMKSMSAKRVKLSLIEAGPRILPALPARIALSAKRELSKLGVDILENTRVIAANEEGFLNGEEEHIPADMMVWAAGVKAPEFMRSIEGLEVARGGQVIVKPTLQSSTNDDIYVIGDCCACEQEDGSFVPPRAQAAHQMASLAYKNIVAGRNGRALKPYVYHDHGSLVNLSNYSTVGNLMGNLSGGNLFIEGRVARFVYISLYRMHQIAIHGWVKAGAIFLAQKVAKSVKPKMKLH